MFIYSISCNHKKWMVERRASKNLEIFDTTKKLDSVNSFLRCDRNMSEVGPPWLKNLVCPWGWMNWWGRENLQVCRMDFLMFQFHSKICFCVLTMFTSYNLQKTWIHLKRTMSPSKNTKQSQNFFNVSTTKKIFN